MTPETTTIAAEAAPAPGVVVVGTEEFMRNSSGHLVPLELVKPIDKLTDQAVRKILGYAHDLSAQIARFKGHSFTDVATLQDLVAELYQAKLGGQKGNVTLTTVDGCGKVVVQVQDQISFGPELQAAKTLVDECITNWSEGSRAEIRALVDHAFQVDREGQINRSALFQLRRIKIEDETWARAMEALSDSIRVIGSQTYMRFYERPDPKARWEPVSIDMASA
ncbi:DUF3164 family protein [Methylopila sp. 73B]|uniref:DUF3164 family protein n=1 Tax=Methylopila sp. 73B TaxID=1120792 RepID=UPI000370703F|nr:DUF3164 family protein [Methylopila sp. 73B]